MMIRLVLALTILLLAANLLAHPPPLSGQSSGKTPHVLACWIYAPPSADTNCTPASSHFPYTVPAGRKFCVQSMALVSKFPYSPPIYGDGMRTLYFAVPGWSAPAHHPEFHFVPPMWFNAGEMVTAAVLNGMPEGQNVYARLGGYLTDAGSFCN